MYDARLDETRWPATSALIDAACGSTGNGLMVGEGPKNDIRGLFVGLYYRGQRREDLEREYLEHYHAIDERVPRFRQLPARRLVHINDLYTAEELKTSPTYNELLRRAGMKDGLNVRLPGLDGSHIGWGLNDPVDSEGWGASRIAMVQRLLPHIQQFVRVRQALVRAEARSSTVTALLDNPRIGVLELDWRGRILEGNDRARSILRHGDGLLDRNGMLRARAPADQVRSNGWWATRCRPLARSLSVGRWCSAARPWCRRSWCTSNRVGGPQPDHGARHVAALVLIVEPGRQHRIDPDLVATALELTPAETKVAVWLAEGNSVGDMADATGHTKAAIYWHLQQIYQKHSISRQADLVRLVLSLAELG